MPVRTSRPERRSRHSWTLLLLLAAGALGSPITAAQPLSERLLLAEDARAQTDAELTALRAGLTNTDPRVRQQSVRAIGRLERADLIPALTRPLADTNADVRVEAANAMAQLARGPKGVTDAKTRLLARLRVEREPRVWGAAASGLGRLPYTTAAEFDEAEAAIARPLPTEKTTAVRIDEVLGAVEGIESLSRLVKISKLKDATLRGLKAASALEGRAQDAEKLARIRRLATLALTAQGAATKPGLDAGIADPDDEVRRLTMIAARGDVEGREAVITKGLGDANPRVRWEAVQSWGRLFQNTSCEPIVKAVTDPNVHVALLAIDLLGNGCPAGPAPASTLRPLADSLTTGLDGWHRAAHALVSLAKTSPADARKILPRHVAHPVWQVRMYAAHAAGALEDVSVLTTLGKDQHDNVREAALSELASHKRAEATAVALDALTRPDYQLVITAARALRDPADKDRSVPALLQALARITAEKKDTSRDPRNAILERLKDLGGGDGAALGDDSLKTLRGYLADFDPAIATRVADMLQGWQKGPAPAAPNPLPRPAVSQASIDAIRGTRIRVVMSNRGPFEMRLFVDEAPLTALRVTTRAREGYYNGLTFHRIAANFVIQGGSPGANEYSGDRVYMRDEVGTRSHQRGTVGISTRGRDTGDAQIFVNLIDSPRLDHLYTVFAEVVSGMDVVDSIIEGDVIERVEVIPASR
jgi:cyclophilin family peptidyl-prolyl cis-trans isomerase/HEAT repeat protein